MGGSLSSALNDLLWERVLYRDLSGKSSLSPEIMTALGLDQAFNAIFFFWQISQIELEKPRGQDMNLENMRWFVVCVLMGMVQWSYLAGHQGIQLDSKFFSDGRSWGTLQDTVENALSFCCLFWRSSSYFSSSVVRFCRFWIGYNTLTTEAQSLDKLLGFPVLGGVTSPSMLAL